MPTAPAAASATSATPATDVSSCIATQVLLASSPRSCLAHLTSSSQTTGTGVSSAKLPLRARCARSLRHSADPSCSHTTRLDLTATDLHAQTSMLMPRRDRSPRVPPRTPRTRTSHTTHPLCIRTTAAASNNRNCHCQPQLPLPTATATRTRRWTKPRFVHRCVLSRSGTSNRSERDRALRRSLLEYAIYARSGSVVGGGGRLGEGGLVARRRPPGGVGSPSGASVTVALWVGGARVEAGVAVVGWGPTSPVGGGSGESGGGVAQQERGWGSNHRTTPGPPERRGRRPPLRGERSERDVRDDGDSGGTVPGVHQTERFGYSKRNEPSRFLGEIPEHLVGGSR